MFYGSYMGQINDVQLLEKVFSCAPLHHISTTAHYHMTFIYQRLTFISFALFITGKSQKSKEWRLNP